MRVLKSLFGPNGLFFVVSISEDAYKQFRSRVAFDESRNEFDSSFDEIIFIEPISYPFMSKVIAGRILGNKKPPIPFLQLTYAVSFGNPRDCLRIARKLVIDHPGADISDVATDLIANDYLSDVSDETIRRLGQYLTDRQHADLVSLYDEILVSVKDGSGITDAHFDKLELVVKMIVKDVKSGKADADKNGLPDLWRLQGTLEYAKVVIDFFAAPSRVSADWFEKLDGDEDDGKKYIEDFVKANALLRSDDSDMAIDVIWKFRERVGLAKRYRKPFKP